MRISRNQISNRRFYFPVELYDARTTEENVENLKALTGANCCCWVN